MRVRALGLTKEPVLSQFTRGRAGIAAAASVVLSVTLLEQPETVEAAPVAVAAHAQHAVSVPAFLGPVGAPSFGHSPIRVALVSARHVARPDERPPAPASRSSARLARKKVRAAGVAHRERARVERRAPAAKRVSSSSGPRRSVSARSARHVAVKSTKRVRKSNTRVRRGMAAVLAYARAQVGKRYVLGSAGPSTFDCSGLTMRAYARAGYRLPHSSGAQAARAYRVSRGAARPGDLVVGPGHVGIYMGGGKMIDAGNRRVGVVYRKVYAGLWIERLR